MKKEHLEAHLGQETPGTVRLSVWNVDRHGQCSLTWFSDIMFGKNKAAGNSFSFLLTFFFGKSWVVYGSEQTEPPFVRTCELGGLSLVCFAAGQWGHIVQGIRWSPYDTIVEDESPFLTRNNVSKGLVQNHQLGFDIFPFVWGSL